MPAKKPANLTVDQYLAGLPTDRREALEALRKVILRNLPKGYEEGIQYGMIGYYVPHDIYPAGYHCEPSQPLPFACLASQKNYMALYLMGVYGSPELEAWFREAWIASGKKLDMGKSCVRFKKLDDVPLAVVGQVLKRQPVKKYIEQYEASLNRPRPSSKTAAKKTAMTSGKGAQTGTRKAAAKKSPAKKGPPKKKPARKRGKA